MTQEHTPIGTLTDRIVIKSRLGENLAPPLSVWARVRSLGGTGEFSHTAIIRFRTDVKIGDQITYRGRSLNIGAAADFNGRRVYLRLDLSEGK